MKQPIFFIIAILLVACENRPKNNDSSSIGTTDYPTANNGYVLPSNRVVTENSSNEPPQNDLVFEERTETTPNTYSYSYSESYSNNDEYSKYSNYEENDDCVDGVVVYEGGDDYYIIETRKGYTILEVYSGILYEGDRVRGELNKYRFKYIINKNRRTEVRVYIEDYMLSDEEALDWLRDNGHIK